MTFLSLARISVAGVPLNYSGLEPDQRDQLIATERDCIGLDITNTAPEPWQSKVGGQPYYVDAAEFPRDDHGNPMVFLIQLNFADLPSLDGFPTTGLLQFFVGNGDAYGLGFGESPDQFQVRFHPVVEPGWEPRSSMALLEYDEDELPFGDELLVYDESAGQVTLTEKSFAVTGTLDRMPVQVNDRRFEALFPDPSDEFLDQLDQVHETQECHWVGGHPSFEQADDRDPDKGILLLKLGSDGDFMLWGDVGTAHFFISEEDLAARRFSAVQYEWSCG